MAAAARLRFVQDDAFISFRYARNLAEGNGLAWNSGERVEGYTNFLWTLLMTPAHTLGLDVVKWSYAFGLACLMANLLLAARIATLMLRSRIAGWATAALLGTNYTFLRYCTGGLETGLQTSLALVSLWLLLEGLRRREWSLLLSCGLSVAAAAAVLTRLDSTLLVGPVMVAALAAVRTSPTPLSQRVRASAALVVPAAIILGTWFAWRIGYYGEWLPNTFFAKLGAPVSQRRGVTYLYVFGLSYGLAPFGLLMAVLAPHLRHARWRAVGGSAVVVAVWCLYIVLVGGDFMEFRFLVPVIPMLYVMMGWIIFRQMRLHSVRLALCLLLVLGSVHHAYRLPHLARGTGIATANLLQSLVYAPWSGWSEIGMTLGELFRPSDGVSIALTPAGAIPYYSGLPAIDMHGLNDHWVARNGRLRANDLPGHQRVATLEYLLRRRAVLVIGHPRLRRQGEPWNADWPVVGDFEANSLILEEERHLLPATAWVVEIPIPPDRFLRALYLTQNDAVDHLIEAGTLIAYPISGCLIGGEEQISDS